MPPSPRLLSRAALGAWPHLLTGVVATLCTAWVLPGVNVTSDPGPHLPSIVPFVDTSTLPGGGPRDPASSPAVRISRHLLHDRFAISPGDDGRFWPWHGCVQTEVVIGQSVDARPFSLPESVVAAPPSGEEASFVGIHTILSGWPFRALAGEVWIPTGNSPLPYEIRHALSVGGSRAEYSRLFLLRPLPLGLLLDILLWACVSWAVALMAWALTRGRRVRSGLCPSCGHSLDPRASTPVTCPECGALAQSDAV
jgi:hypothetical protein